MKKFKYISILIAVILLVTATLTLTANVIYSFASGENEIKSSVIMVVGDVSSPIALSKLDSVEIISDNGENVVEFDYTTKTYTAKKAGKATINISVPFSKSKSKTISVEVYPVGSGSYNDPFNIVTPEHLSKALASDDAMNSSYILRSDLDYINIGNFEPIGTNEKPFKGSFNGNGYTIKNLTIRPSLDDFSLSKDVKDVADGKNDIYIGFFGKIQGESSENPALIKGLSFKNMVIDTYQKGREESFENQLYSNYSIARIYVGSLAGGAINADIYGENCLIESKILSNVLNSYLPTYTRSGLAGCVGYLDYSKLNGYSVDTNIDSSSCVYIENGNEYGPRIGAAVCNMFDSEIKNMRVNSIISTKNLYQSKASGFVLCAFDSKVLDSYVESVNINVSKYDDDSDGYFTTYNGVLCYAGDRNYPTTTIENVVVDRVKINADKGYNSGFAYENNGIIKNCALKNCEINGYECNGFLYKNYGNVIFDKGSFSFNNTLNTQTSAAGFIYINYSNASIKSSKNRTNINTTINFVADNVIYYDYGSSDTSYQKLNSLDDYSYVSAGFVHTNFGDIEKFDVFANINKNVNISGLFGYIFGGNIKEIKLTSNINTFTGSHNTDSITKNGDYYFAPTDGITFDVADLALSISNKDIDFDKFSYLNAAYSINRGINISDIEMNVSVNNPKLANVRYSISRYAGIAISIEKADSLNVNISKIDNIMSVNADGFTQNDMYSNFAIIGGSIITSSDNITSVGNINGNVY